MPRIHNFAEAQAALLPYVPLVAQLTGKDTTLERIRPLMELAGKPHERLKIVHIAGTSGKTSTAYFTAELLRATGMYVGLTVSPHVDSIAERVQLDGKPLDEKQFCENLTEFLAIVEQMPQQPSYFELLYAFSLWVFARNKVNYAVVETGLGGLYDSTNIADRADKLCIITDIGFDHMYTLGNTLEEIAAQKAGIIHEHNQAIMYEQAESVTNVVRQWVADQHAKLLLTSETSERDKYGVKFLPSMPEYQQRNWLLAHCAYQFLAVRDHLPGLSPTQLTAMQQIQVPARMDVHQVGNKLIIMDGAHNEQKMSTFLGSFQHAYPGEKPAVLLALKQGKEVQDIGHLFLPMASRIIVTTFNTSQDLPAKSIDPEEIVAIFKAAGIVSIEAIPNQHAAYQKLLTGTERVCIITGSFYLISQLRQREGLVA